MADVPNLRAIEAVPRGRSVVAVLEDILKAAKRGEFSSIAVAVVYPDGTTGTMWSEIPSLDLMLGSVAGLQFEIAGLLKGQ